jgi:hypothetical protein
LGSSVSGHTFVHPLASVQVIFPPFSDVSTYRVWPCPLTRTVPAPGTLFALIATAAGDDVPTGALLDEFAGVPLDEPAPVPVEDVPQAAAVATAPRARLPNSSRRPGERWER